MSFERVVCWDPDRVSRVMEIEAEEAQPPIFMAVHTDEPLALARPLGERSAREFLDEFLGARGDVRAVVIGDSGSGKSHFVHWVQLNVPQQPDLRVVSVPRSGTSLRWIVERLIDELPPSTREDYRRLLVQVPRSTTDFKDLQLSLLTKVAIAVQRARQRTEVDRDLAERLCDFLLEPPLREHHTGAEGIITELAKHITSNTSGREERVARRRFQESDLHLDHVMTRRGEDLSAPTRSLLRSLQGNRVLRERAVELVNENLDTAVTETLGLNSDQLTEMLNTIRRHLRSQGQQLVLLVEDLVRAEGIDRALLGALIERGDDLCDLRLLIAVTTGYYERELLDTLKTRMNFIINLDKRPPLDEEDRLAPFAARYLNALRLPESELDHWFRESRDGEAAVSLPNACSSCQHRAACHASFGSRPIEGAGEVGLYPFTDQALANMAGRSRSEGQLGPRELLRDILRPVVDERRARAIRDGDFPDAPLLESHSGPKLPLDLQGQIPNLGGANAARYRTLLELWSARPGEATQLPEGLYGAFSLAPLTLGEEPPPATEADRGAHLPDDPPAEELPTTPAVPSTVRRRLQAIEEWGNSNPMTGATTNELRGLVFRAIVAAIDWDAEGLEQAVFAGSRGGARDSFHRTSIDFERQDTAWTKRQITLRLPLAGDLDSQFQAARALQGLVNFEHFGHWNFQNGLDQLLVVSEELPKWTDHIIRQLRRVHDPKRKWNPVASAVEALAIGATLGSRPSQLGASLVDRLAAMFEEWPDPTLLRVQSEEWRSLYRDIYDHRADLRSLVLAHAAAMKGGQSGPMIEAAQVVRPLRAIARDWVPRAAPPERLNDENLPPRYRQLVNLHRRIREQLPDVAEHERELRLGWLDEVRVAIPSGVERRAVVASIEQLIGAIGTYGLAVRSDQLDEPLDELKAAHVDEAIRITEELRSLEGSAQEQLPRLASERRGNAVQAVNRFLSVSTQFLDNVESRARSEKEKTTASESAAQQTARINTAFTNLERALEAVGEPSP